MMQCRTDERDLLAHALRVRTHPPIACIEQVELLQELVDPAPAQLKLDLINDTEIIKVCAHRHALVEARYLRHQSHLNAYNHRINRNVDAVNNHTAQGQQQNPNHTTKHSGLPNAIAPKQNKTATFVNP